MLRLALRNVLRHRFRTGLTLAAIALGVASIILSGGFVEDLLLQLREATIRSQLGHLQIYRQGKYASGAPRAYEFLIDEPRAVEQRIDEHAAVVAHGRRLGFSGLLGDDRGDIRIIGEGVEPAPEARIGSALTMLSGRQLAPGDKSAAIVGEGIATAMGLKPGSRVNLVVSTREGAMNVLDFEVVGVFRSLSREYDAHAVRIPLAAAQELTATSAISAIVVLLADTNSTEWIKHELEREIPAGYEIKTWQELADFYNNTAALYERQFGILRLIIAAMVVLSVANSINMTLHERTAEFGIMRAVGETGAGVFGVAMVEAAILGMLGAALGVIIGVALSALIGVVGIPMPPPPNSEAGFTATVRLTVPLVIEASALGFIATVVAAFWPAWRLTRIPVVEALRRGV